MKDEDPFKAIREVHKTYSLHIERVKGNQLAASTFPFVNAFFALWNAIEETIKVIGEEEK